MAGVKATVEKVTTPIGNGLKKVGNKVGDGFNFLGRKVEQGLNKILPEKVAKVAYRTLKALPFGLAMSLLPMLVPGAGIFVGIGTLVAALVISQKKSQQASVILTQSVGIASTITAIARFVHAFSSTHPALNAVFGVGNLGLAGVCYYTAHRQEAKLNA